MQHGDHFTQTSMWWTWSKVEILLTSPGIKQSLSDIPYRDPFAKNYTLADLVVEWTWLYCNYKTYQNHSCTRDVGIKLYKSALKIWLTGLLFSYNYYQKYSSCCGYLFLWHIHFRITLIRSSFPTMKIHNRCSLWRPKHLSLLHRPIM